MTISVIVGLVFDPLDALVALSGVQRLLGGLRTHNF
jgi:hypothetical protein